VPQASCITYYVEALSYCFRSWIRKRTWPARLREKFATSVLDPHETWRASGRKISLGILFQSILDFAIRCYFSNHVARLRFCRLRCRLIRESALRQRTEHVFRVERLRCIGLRHHKQGTSGKGSWRAFLIFSEETRPRARTASVLQGSEHCREAK
jgi:hypothetical protein